MNRTSKTIYALAMVATIPFAGICGSGPHGWATLNDLPVSSVGNAAYLTSASETPWWNRAWKKRMPILVSSAAKVNCGKAFIDCAVDFGEKVNPDEVRVVTPWGTLVDCVASSTSTQNFNSLRLTFQTSLRIEENKPFFVYWDNPGAKAPRVWSGMTMQADEKEIRIANGVIDVIFDNLGRTYGLLKQIRVLGSQTPNELLDRATGYAWCGFRLNEGAFEPWSKGKVVVDNPFVKSVRFENSKFTLDFTIYADQPRIDYSYTFKRGGNLNANLGISWSVGDGTGEDDLYYRGLNGKTLSLRAALDCATDNIKNPYYSDLAPFFSEGWYAIRDRIQGEVVGHFFNRDTLTRFEYTGAGQHAGERAQLTFSHGGKKDDTLGGSGALIAMMGEVSEIRNEYLRYANSPIVSLGRTETVREIPVRIPRLDHDFCADFNIGKGSGAGWESGEPLEGREWCSNIVDHIRVLGANAVRIGGYGWQDLAVTKDQYDRIAKFEAGPFGNKNHKLPEWKEGAFTGAKFREHCEAAHAKGIAVSLWSGFLPGVRCNKDEALWDKEAQALDVELQSLYVDLGADSIYNAHACREGAQLPKAVTKDRGSSWWTWEKPEDFFKTEDIRTEEIKTFYRESKKRHPNTPVIVMNSECSITSRETMMTDQIGAFDSVYSELLPLCDSPRSLVHTKMAVKRLRALYDNEAGRTVHSHFYYYGHKATERVLEIELPFIWGANGFTFENLTYENFGKEQSNITGDAYRFLEYTKLGDKVAKMAPVKDVAVFRDNRCYVQDVIHRRTGKNYAYTTEQDGRANSYFELKGVNIDVVVDRFFTAEALAKYRVVIVPEDPAFGEDRAKELLAFVKNGGGVLIEGGIYAQLGRDGAPSPSEGLKDGEVVACGKGRIAWVKDPLSDRLCRGRDSKALAKARELLLALGSRPPFTLESKMLDANLEASSEGMFLGVYNEGSREESGKVAINEEFRIKNEEWRNGLFVLDVKQGVRFAYTNGFEISVGPKQSGFYLIGDEKFTALPETRRAEWLGASVARRGDMGRGCKAPDMTPVPDFPRVVAVEFVPNEGSNYRGEPTDMRRSQEAGFDRIRICTDEKFAAEHPGLVSYETGAMKKALAKATYLHLAAPTKDCELVFRECKDELKAMLKRGGGILFDKRAPGPEAAKFLAEVGVFNPYPSVKKNVGDCKVVWNEAFPTNHPFAALDLVKEGWGEDGQYVRRLSKDGGGYSLAFGQWDKEKQLTPYFAARDKNYTHFVMQENVLGAGKIAFNENTASFNDWYEAKVFGNAVLGWLGGIPVKDYKVKVERFNGGPGKIEN